MFLAQASHELVPPDVSHVHVCSMHRAICAEMVPVVYIVIYCFVYSSAYNVAGHFNLGTTYLNVELAAVHHLYIAV